jgi:aminoglycoside 6'-N-acetyltransferase
MFKYVNKACGLAEIGYCLNVASQGKGYAVEAVKALMGFAFNALAAHKLIAMVDTRNLASAKLSEKVGMRQEACFIERDKIKGQWCDIYCYAILAREFNAL